MKLYTIGFTQKSAEKFFGLIKFHKIKILIDIRLNNKSQLSGFAIGRDLPYFLRKLCECKYEYRPEYAPAKEILDDYRSKNITWKDYEEKYISLMKEREIVKDFEKRFRDWDSVCLLCSEATPEKCHRRLLAEMIAENNSEIKIFHI